VKRKAEEADLKLCPPLGKYKTQSTAVVLSNLGKNELESFPINSPLEGTENSLSQWKIIRL
jgi:hypothetical protein